jgi:hypothetical protein
MAGKVILAGGDNWLWLKPYRETEGTITGYVVNGNWKFSYDKAKRKVCAMDYAGYVVNTWDTDIYFTWEVVEDYYEASYNGVISLAQKAYKEQQSAKD